MQKPFPDQKCIKTTSVCNRYRCPSLSIAYWWQCNSPRMRIISCHNVEAVKTSWHDVGGYAYWKKSSSSLQSGKERETRWSICRCKAHGRYGFTAIAYLLCVPTLDCLQLPVSQWKSRDACSEANRGKWNRTQDTLVQHTCSALPLGHDDWSTTSPLNPLLLYTAQVLLKCLSCTHGSSYVLSKLC